MLFIKPSVVSVPLSYPAFTRTYSQSKLLASTALLVIYFQGLKPKERLIWVILSGSKSTVQISSRVYILLLEYLPYGRNGPQWIQMLCITQPVVELVRLG